MLCLKHMVKNLQNASVTKARWPGVLYSHHQKMVDWYAWQVKNSHMYKLTCESAVVEFEIEPCGFRLFQQGAKISERVCWLRFEPLPERRCNISVSNCRVVVVLGKTSFVMVVTPVSLIMCTFLINQGMAITVQSFARFVWDKM